MLQEGWNAQRKISRSFTLGLVHIEKAHRDARNGRDRDEGKDHPDPTRASRTPIATSNPLRIAWGRGGQPGM